MHPGQVLPDDTEGKQPGTGEDDDDRSQEREAGHTAARGDVASNDVEQQQTAQERETETHQTGKLEREYAESSHHVDGMSKEFAKGIVGGAGEPGVVANP